MERQVMMGAIREAIRCENLSKHFGKFEALKDLTLNVEHGGAYGFLGPNGSGKTTTLRLFTGLTNPTEGRVWVAGEDVSGKSLQLRSKVGYLPEAPAFYGWMTGREFLSFTGELYGLGSRDAKLRAGELLEMVNLDDAADRKVKGYSRGMQQRLGLAQALVHKPEVLFLDEPASALDPMGRRDMLETMISLKGETTIFVSTHILADVERVCDHVAIINRGRLVTTGSIGELRARQQTSVFEMEFEEDPGPMARQMAGIPWVKSMDSYSRGDRQVFRIDVTDVNTAKKELLRLAYESELTLLRYELVSASLEEVFMDLVGGEEAEA
jgi:ABC-2 type transport system ATP-binding protein